MEAKKPDPNSYAGVLQKLCEAAQEKSIEQEAQDCEALALMNFFEKEMKEFQGPVGKRFENELKIKLSRWPRFSNFEVLVTGDDHNGEILLRDEKERKRIQEVTGINCGLWYEPSGLKDEKYIWKFYVPKDWSRRKLKPIWDWERFKDSNTWAGEGAKERQNTAARERLEGDLYEYVEAWFMLQKAKAELDSLTQPEYWYSIERGVEAALKY